MFTIENMLATVQIYVRFVKPYNCSICDDNNIESINQIKIEQKMYLLSPEVDFSNRNLDKLGVSVS